MYGADLMSMSVLCRCALDGVHQYLGSIPSDYKTGDQHAHAKVNLNNEQR